MKISSQIGRSVHEYYILPAEFLQQQEEQPAPTVKIQLNDLRKRIGD